jgi:hypothetical protein
MLDKITDVAAYLIIGGLLVAGGVGAIYWFMNLFNFD